MTETYYKAVRPNGTDWWAGTVRWLPEDGVVPVPAAEWEAFAPLARGSVTSGKYTLEAARALVQAADALDSTAPDRLDRMERALREVMAIHEPLWGCGNPGHTNPEVGCPECEVICDGCGGMYQMVESCTTATGSEAYVLRS